MTLMLEAGKKRNSEKDSGYNVFHLLVEDQLLKATLTVIFITFILPTLIPVG